MIDLPDSTLLTTVRRASPERRSSLLCPALLGRLLGQTGHFRSLVARVVFLVIAALLEWCVRWDQETRQVPVDGLT